MKQTSFKTSFQGSTLIGDTIIARTNTNWLCLHGAGQADGKRFSQLRKLLAHKDIGSYSFDFIGHGETGGDLHGSSLESRVAQVSAVIESQGLQQPLSIIASSMGGYVAIKLTELYKVQNLILLAPAVYTTKAHNIPFGPAFTETVRNPFSWRETDAWKILERYTGNLLIYEAEHDQIIPHEIIERIYNAARNAKSREVIVIKEATHSLAKWLDERPDFLEEIVGRISRLAGPDSL